MSVSNNQTKLSFSESFLRPAEKASGSYTPLVGRALANLCTAPGIVTGGIAGGLSMLIAKSMGLDSQKAGRIGSYIGFGLSHVVVVPALAMMTTAIVMLAKDKNTSSLPFGQQMEKFWKNSCVILDRMFKPAASNSNLNSEIGNDLDDPALTRAASPVALEDLTAMNSVTEDLSTKLTRTTNPAEKLEIAIDHLKRLEVGVKPFQDMVVDHIELLRTLATAPGANINEFLEMAIALDQNNPHKAYWLLSSLLGIGEHTSDTGTRTPRNVANLRDAVKDPKVIYFLYAIEELGRASPNNKTLLLALRKAHVNGSERKFGQILTKILKSVADPQIAGQISPESKTVANEYISNLNNMSSFKRMWRGV